MFTESRRVPKFLVVALLLAVGPVQSLMKPALAATPGSIPSTLGRPEADLKVLELRKRATTTTTALPIPALTLTHPLQPSIGMFRPQGDLFPPS